MSCCSSPTVGPIWSVVASWDVLRAERARGGSTTAAARAHHDGRGDRDTRGEDRRRGRQTYRRPTAGLSGATPRHHNVMVAASYGRTVRLANRQVRYRRLLFVATVRWCASRTRKRIPAIRNAPGGNVMNDMTETVERNAREFWTIQDSILDSMHDVAAAWFERRHAGT